MRAGSPLRITLPTLGTCFHDLDAGSIGPCGYEIALPADWRPDRPARILVFIGGGMGGGRYGDIAKAQELVAGSDLIAVSVPLFKCLQDRSEPYEGRFLSWSDYALLERAFRIIFDDLFTRLAPGGTTGHIIGGYSNGGIATAMVLTMGCTDIIRHFDDYILIDGGMLHLADLHKEHFRGKRMLVVVGDRRADEGYLGMLRQPYLESARLLHALVGEMDGRELDLRILHGLGHGCQLEAFPVVRQWLDPDHTAT